GAYRRGLPGAVREGGIRRPLDKSPSASRGDRADRIRADPVLNRPVAARSYVHRDLHRPSSQGDVPPGHAWYVPPKDACPLKGQATPRVAETIWASHPPNPDLPALPGKACGQPSSSISDTPCPWRVRIFRPVARVCVRL